MINSKNDNIKFFLRRNFRIYLRIFFRIYMNFTISSSIKDNHKRGSVGEFLKENIRANSKLSIVSAYFTIFAYQKLKIGLKLNVPDNK